MYFYTWLVISGSGEYLRFLSRDSCIGFDEFSHHPTHSFDTKGKRSYVKEQYIFYISSKYSTLDSCTDSYYLIRIYTLIRFLSKELLYSFLYSRDTSRTSYEDYLIDVTYLKTSILKRFFTRFDSTSYQIFNKLFELSTGKSTYQVLRSCSSSSDIRKVNLCLHRRRKFYFSFFSSFFESL